ncbi:MAG: hypothetical protein WC389_01270 [Lutibacter sp.]|jgi:hypothetical protein
MIKGKVKENLNEFEFEIELLLGSLHERTGYIYYFDLLQETFLRASKHLIIDSQQFKKELEEECPENKQSLIKSNEGVVNPLIETLYKSYFITLCSELEIILTKVNEIIERYYNENSFFPLKAREGDFKSLLDGKKTTKAFIIETLKQHKILTTYNYIRNGLIHSKNCKESPEFIKLKTYITNGKINNLKIIDNEKGFRFLITDIDFIINYSKVIILFFQNLINNSVKNRK